RPIVSSPSPKRCGKQQRQVPLYTVGVDAAKSLLMGRLKTTERGPGYIHLPSADWCDDEFLKQLTSEKLVTKRHKGLPVQTWQKIRPRNEALDCAVYAIAALRLLNPKLTHMREQLRQRAPRPATPHAATAAPPSQGPPPRPAPRPAVRRVSHSGYLGRGQQ